MFRCSTIECYLEHGLFLLETAHPANYCPVCGTEGVAMIEDGDEYPCAQCSKWYVANHVTHYPAKDTYYKSLNHKQRVKCYLCDKCKEER